MIELTYSGYACGGSGFLYFTTSGRYLAIVKHRVNSIKKVDNHFEIVSLTPLIFITHFLYNINVDLLGSFSGYLSVR